MNAKNNNRYAVIVFVLMICLAVAVVYVGGFLLPGLGALPPIVATGTNNELVHIPRVSSSVNAADGSAHVVTVDFTIAVDETVRRDLDINGIHARMTRSLENMQYDLINAPDGIDYIKGEIIRDLSGEYVRAEDFRGLFIRNIVRDDNFKIRALESMNFAQRQANPPEPRRNLNDFFEAIRLP